MKRIDVSDDRTLIYSDPSMQGVINDVEAFAPTNTSVLITGENGTGKENIARLIHQNSGKADQPFVAINCSAISPNLIESELFGHEQGAFTGANKKRIGAFEKANGGTLFLDEIGDMPPEMQVKLLRVLQDGEFTRVGSNDTLIAKPRIISATNSNIEKALEEGKLREDLYYRLSRVEIDLPPLVKRSQDIPALAAFFISKAAKENQLAKTPRLSNAAVETLRSYPWPGNIRQLENSIIQATIRAQKTGEITPDMLRLKKRTPKATEQAAVQNTTIDMPLEKTFGYKVSVKREERNWLQRDLAQQIQEHTSKDITEEDVKLWENNEQVPEQDIVNALAYLLIIDTDKIDKAKESDLKEFFDAAHETRKALQGGLILKEDEGFGNKLRLLREQLGLTQTELVKQANKINATISLEPKDLYSIEANHPRTNLTPAMALTVVKALDRQAGHDCYLSPEDKLELYESAKPLFKPYPTGEYDTSKIKFLDNEQDKQNYLSKREELQQLVTKALGGPINMVHLASAIDVTRRDLTILGNGFMEPRCSHKVQLLLTQHLRKHADNHLVNKIDELLNEIREIIAMAKTPSK